MASLRTISALHTSANEDMAAVLRCSAPAGGATPHSAPVAPGPLAPGEAATGMSVERPDMRASRSRILADLAGGFFASEGVSTTKSG